ncbi:chlorophyll a/b-binding protein [Leptolyngbya sp. PCC 6406]|uniref:chlorophyll a/b-binding protein n=1 Tax=Leptolyngbya sp. PCC 6406 TaxID=1173264 RepID=UPI0002ABA58D|nr:chlorophyll a/b-binding protein [Leptolyngbya sp. PCC 6406]
MLLNMSFPDISVEQCEVDMQTIPTPKDLNQPGISDGSELIPAEVGAAAEREGQPAANPSAPPTSSLSATAESPTTAGYTVDQEGLVNNYPVTPDMYVQKQARFGWTHYAETLNGRLAMIGFGLLLLTEVISGESFVSLWSRIG